MKDRIKEFMVYKSLSAGELADTLEVQRSNISHVLNGRNKPGANFIEKLLLNFPDIDARWLMTGIGEMLVTNGNALNKINKITLESPVIKPSESQPLKDNENTIPTTKNDLRPIAPSESMERKDSSVSPIKRIDKIVVLFNDGTFTDYDKHQS